MSVIRPRPNGLHGYKPIGISRFLALYVAQAFWIYLGVWLLSHAYWPSTCTPNTLVKMYGCSFRLPEGRTWIETGLATWLWSTPILIALEVLRWFGPKKKR